MQLENTFAVTAPIDEVWETLMRFDRVGSCLPGASVAASSEDTYDVTMRVKLGPMLMMYTGTMAVVERDVAAHRAVIAGKAQEVKGQGTASGMIELRLTEEGAVTRGTCSAQVKLSGKAAAMGKGVISKVGDQLMAQFAENLQGLLTGEPQQVHPGDDSAAHERSGETVVEGVETLATGSQSEGVLRDPDEATPRTAPVEQVRGDEAMTEGRSDAGTGGGTATAVPETRMPEAPVSGGAQSSPAARVSDRVSSSERPAPSARWEDEPASAPEPLDVLGLVRGMVGEQLSRPPVVVGLMLPVALLIGIWIGRRGARRS